MQLVQRISLGIGALVLLAIIGLYGASEFVLRRAHATPRDHLIIPADAASIAEGGRLAHIEGCRGCHGPNGGGTVLADDVLLGWLATPALARIAAQDTNEDLVRTIRYGVHRDGRALLLTPTHAHRYLADEDVAKIVAWIRTLRPRTDDEQRGLTVGPLGRALVLGGAVPLGTQTQRFAAARRATDTGRYFVTTSCTMCHRLDRDTPSEDGSGVIPALAPVAASYDLPAFTHLLRTGVGMSNRNLGLMSQVAKSDLSALNDPEIAAVHSYLTATATGLPRR